MKIPLVLLGLLALMPGAALAQGTYYVDYFANNSGPVPGSPDQIISWINVGTLGTPLTSPVGDICVSGYTFNADQEMISCCAGRLTPNETQSASVGFQLTANPVTSVVPTSGVVKIILAPPPPGGCDPTVSTTTPDATSGVLTATHLQAGPSGLFVTETQLLPSPLSKAEEGFLQTACAFTLFLGSGKGTCR
jgi:hypothetical protein